MANPGGRTSISAHVVEVARGIFGKLGKRRERGQYWDFRNFWGDH